MTIGPIQLVVLGFPDPDFHGTIITELHVPDKDGKMADVVLGKSQGVVEFDPRRFSGET